MFSLWDASWHIVNDMKIRVDSLKECCHLRKRMLSCSVFLCQYHMNWMWFSSFWKNVRYVKSVNSAAVFTHVTVWCRRKQPYYNYSHNSHFIVSSNQNNCTVFCLLVIAKQINCLSWFNSHLEMPQAVMSISNFFCHFENDISAFIWVLKPTSTAIMPCFSYGNSELLLLNPDL